MRAVSSQILQITPLLSIRNHSIAHWRNQEHHQDPYHHDLYKVSGNIIQAESIWTVPSACNTFSLRCFPPSQLQTTQDTLNLFLPVTSWKISKDGMLQEANGPLQLGKRSSGCCLPVFSNCLWNSAGILQKPKLLGDFWNGDFNTWKYWGFFSPQQKLITPTRCSGEVLCFLEKLISAPALLSRAVCPTWAEVIDGVLSVNGCSLSRFPVPLLSCFQRNHGAALLVLLEQLLFYKPRKSTSKKRPKKEKTSMILCRSTGLYRTVSTAREFLFSTAHSHNTR